MEKEFSGDWLIYRICMSTPNPLETLHNIRNDKYSVNTILQYVEMLDVKDTMREDAQKQVESKQR